MNKLKCVHLNDDFSLGGVVKGLQVFDHPQLARYVDSHVLQVNPRRELATKLDADVIITHFPPSWSSMPFLVSLKLHNPTARLIHIEHSYTGSWAALKVPSMSRFRSMLRFSYSMFEQVIAVSKGQAQWLAKLGAVPAPKLRVLHPWSGSQGLQSLRAPNFRNRDKITIGAIGRFAWVKGFDVLIEAMRDLPADRYDLVLGGYGEEENALHELAEGQDNIRFAGKIDDAAEFYGSCDLVVVPSRWEAFGQVAAEARMAGRPIVVSDLDGLTEQVGEAGLAIDCSDPHRLAEAIRSLSADRMQAMSKAAYSSMAGAETSRILGWLALFTQPPQSKPA